MNFTKSKALMEFKCPSPDGSGYPFLPVFGEKDRNVQREELLKS